MIEDVVYAPLSTLEPMTWEIPSTKGGVVIGPAPCWGLAKDIDRLTKRNETEGGLSEPTAYADALMVAWWCHPKTKTNLLTADKQPLPRTQETLDALLTNEDLESLQMFLLQHFDPKRYEIMMAIQNMQSADPNFLEPILPDLNESLTIKSRPSRASTRKKRTRGAAGSRPTPKAVPDSAS